VTERLSLAIRTQPSRIKLLISRSHRPSGSLHNKNTSLLRISGQMEQLPASSGLLQRLLPRLVHHRDVADGILCLLFLSEENRRSPASDSQVSEHEAAFISVLHFIRQSKGNSYFLCYPLKHNNFKPLIHITCVSRLY
jgi:hypothetical protein